MNDLLALFTAFLLKANIHANAEAKKAAAAKSHCHDSFYAPFALKRRRFSEQNIAADKGSL